MATACGVVADGALFAVDPAEAATGAYVLIHHSDRWSHRRSCDDRPDAALSIFVRVQFGFR